MNPPQRIPGEKIEELLDRLIHPGNDAAEIPSPFSASTAEDRGDCPQEAVWHRIAARLSSDEEARAGIEHAAQCQRCGGILSFWANILADEETPTETAALARLSALSLGWQERMTQTLCAADPSANYENAKSGKWSGRALWPAILAVTGALAASGLCFLFLGNSHRQNSPERLLAEAYSGNRIMETRIPLATFSAMDAVHRSRSAGAGAMSDSVPLLEARAAITQALMKTPEDPHWLLLQARSDLLNQNYDTAIDTLKRLQAGDPANVPVLTDLASAYLMRSKATDTPIDEASALDYLEQAARLDPKNPVVLYNKAVVLQDLFQYINAVDTWKRFLAVEQDPAWAADGKRRLAEIEARDAKVKAQQSRLAPYLATPDGMLHLARSPAVIAEYDEELSIAYLSQLLKTAFPLTASPDSSPSHPTFDPAACGNSCSAARTLLTAIAASLEEHHHDQWLADLLSGPVTPDFEVAANSLARALTVAQYASPADALREAQNTQRAFQSIGNNAGIAMARGLQIYNFEHLLDARKCLAAARDLPSFFASNRYPWLEAQFWADESACHARQNDFAAARASLDRSLQVSAGAGYRIMHLRSFGFAASDEQSIGNRDLAWKMNLQLLQTYWSGNYPMLRRLQPYVGLAYTEQESTHFYSAVVLRREAVGAAELLGNPEVLNANRFLLVKAEIRSGEMQEAARDLTIARAELAALPGHDALRGTADDIGIFLAEAYLARNDPAAAAGMLRTVAADVDNTGNRDMELRYAAAAGHLALLEGQPQQAEEELTREVAIAERGYRDIHGDQDRVDWIEGSREVYAALALLQLREGRGALEALATWERYRILSSGIPLQQWCQDTQLTCLARPLEAARKALKQETILGTIRFDRVLLLWTMDDRGIQMREVAIDPEHFDLLCHTFSETLATPASSESGIRFYGGRLAASLLAPVASQLDSHRTLVFDLDDSMEFLPVAALPVNGRYLGLQFATSTAHSVLLASRRPSDTSRSRKSVVVGASDPGDPEVPRLPEAKAEALAVAGFLARPQVFVGRDAVVGPIEAALPHAALIHFAGHTRFADGGTRLLLAQPSKSGPDWLDAHAFRSHDFAGCRLVVLSACSTGKREERGADDIQDIVQTLTAEGAQQIVATHWDVDSAASVSLMKEFYSALARGQTVPQALLQAERSVSATPEYRHPYYWSPYYSIGTSTLNLKELLHDD